MISEVCDADERGRDARLASDVTFLFSDIEDAAARYERDRHAMAAASRAHDALVRRSIEAHGGFIFKTIGNAFCAAFREPPEALRAALAISRALAAASVDVDGIAVRIALHCGSADARDGDYFGVPVNRVARLLAIAHGGQIVLSEVAAQRLRDASPSLAVRDLGLHRLKDLAQPERVFQVLGDDLREEFPPLRSLGRFDNNLPQQLTSLIDRDDEVGTVTRLLASTRAVTLAGSAGIGKTRVALQAGAELLDVFSDGVWFVDFAAHGNAASMIAGIASVFGLRERPGDAFERTVLTYLGRKHLLLILDNCEHLVTETARIATAILHAAPRVSLVVTSRQPLGIERECVYRLPSLAVPAPGIRLSAQTALRYGAVRLFVERGMAAARTFALHEENAATIGDIVRRLDGIALAIELAAARMQALSPAQLAGRLDERFRLLSGGNRGALPRQQTMRAAIAWSFDLLSEAEQSLFEQLTIFSGGWSGEAAVAICTDGGTACAIADALATLVDKSLVVCDAAGPPRYRLLESIREYGLQRLEASGKTESVARRHAMYFAAFAQRADIAFDRTPDLVWFADVGLELDNVRAALDWSIERQHDPALGAALAAALRPFWAVKAPVEGHRWLERAEPAVDSDAAPARSPPRSPWDSPGRRVARTADPITGSRTRARDVSPARRRARLGACARFLRRRARMARTRRAGTGKRALHEALAIHRRRADDQLVGVDLCALAVLERIRGRLPQSRALFAAALELFEVAQSTRGRAAVLANLADLEYAAGNVARAIALAGDAQRAYRLLEDRAPRRATRLQSRRISSRARPVRRRMRACATRRATATRRRRCTVSGSHGPGSRRRGGVCRRLRACRGVGSRYSERRSRSLPRGTGAIEPDLQPIASLLRDNVAANELVRPARTRRERSAKHSSSKRLYGKAMAHDVMPIVGEPLASELSDGELLRHRFRTEHRLRCDDGRAGNMPASRNITQRSLRVSRRRCKPARAKRCATRKTRSSPPTSSHASPARPSARSSQGKPRSSAAFAKMCH